MSRRTIKALSLFLGTLLLLFGFLKFFEPFSGWFVTQIQQSHLPRQAMLPGKLSEMLTGLLFLLPWWPKTLTISTKGRLLLTACLLLAVQMIVAIYVHLQPGVPASVLPLGIKPPVIPVFVLLLGVVLAVGVWTDLRGEMDRKIPKPA